MAKRDSKSIAPGTMLSCLPLFGGLEPELLARLGTACRILELPTQHSLFYPGDPIGDAHFLVTGSVKRSALLYDGAEKILELVRPGQMIAPSEAFSSKAYGSLAETIGASVLIVIAVDTLLGFIGQDPTLNQRFLRMLAERYYAAEFEAISHHSLSVNQRVLDYLLHLAGKRHGIAGETTVHLDAKKHLIAARLGMAPETFSRALQYLSKEGVIVVSGRSLHIQNAMLVSNACGTQESGRVPLRFPRPEREGSEARRSPAALVNLCGRQRMLSQRMATAWGMVARKLSPGTARVTLRRFLDQFEHNLEQLAALPLPSPIREKLTALGTVWQDYLDLLTAQTPLRSHAEAVLDMSEQILAAADALTAAMATEAGTAEARLVNVAGRNRMLSARLTKLFLFRDWEVCSTTTEALMAESRQEFNDNMEVLATRSIASPEALAQLAIDAEQWRSFIASIDSEVRPTAEHGHLRTVLAASEELLRHVDTTVKLYELLAIQHAMSTGKTMAATKG